MSDEDIEQLDATNPNETPELEPELDDTEDVEALRDQLAKAREAQRQILARAKKAEEALKSQASQPKTSENNQPTQTPTASVEETVLLANGMPEELLSELKAIAAVRNVSLIKAQHDPIFVAMKDQKEKEKKQQEASMPASRGSGQSKPKKDFKTPGLSEAEYREMFESKFNR